MTGAALIKALRKVDCVVLRQKGSHCIVRCGKCQTVIPVHNEDLGKGLLHAIEKQLEACLGKGWLDRL